MIAGLLRDIATAEAGRPRVEAFGTEARAELGDRLLIEVGAFVADVADRAVADAEKVGQCFVCQPMLGLHRPDDLGERRPKIISGRQGHWQQRSEEHTSELQSLMRNSYAVFCLKKKKKNITNIV